MEPTLPLVLETPPPATHLKNCSAWPGYVLEVWRAATGKTPEARPVALRAPGRKQPGATAFSEVASHAQAEGARALGRALAREAKRERIAERQGVAMAIESVLQRQAEADLAGPQRRREP